MYEKNFDSMLSKQAEASRRIGPCYDAAGEMIRADAEYQQAKKDAGQDGTYGMYQSLPWDAGERYWKARDKYVESTSRGGGTINYGK